MPIRKITANISFLTQGVPVLILDADAAAGATSITVKSILGVAVNRLLLFREPGNEHAEIIATHAGTAPSGNTVTLVAAGLVEAHPAGTKIYVVNYNQVRFYRSATEDDANSDASNLAALAAAQNIDPTQVDNIYEDTAQASGFYYYRFSDSVNAVNGLYSDPIPWNIVEPQFAIDEVGYILKFVRRKLGFDWSEKFSKETAFDEINACLNYAQGKLKHWSKYLVSDYVLGQTSRGVFDYALPSDIYDNETNKSILQVRLGTNVSTLLWKDEREFDNLMGDAVRTTVRTLAVVGATTLEIVNSYDFDSSGTIHAFTSNTDDAITYTGVTRSATAGVLTGVPATGDGAIGAAHAVGINVWQDHEEGEPLYYNVRQGRLRVWPLSDSTWINLNVRLDYNEQATLVDSESDTLDSPRFDMVKHWLLWKAKSYLRNDGKDDLTDADYVIFRDILTDAIKKENSGQKWKMSPKINKIIYTNSRGSKFENI